MPSGLTLKRSRKEMKLLNTNSRAFTKTDRGSIKVKSSNEIFLDARSRCHKCWGRNIYAENRAKVGTQSRWQLRRRATDLASGPLFVVPLASFCGGVQGVDVDCGAFRWSEEMLPKLALHRHMFRFAGD